MDHPPDPTTPLVVTTTPWPTVTRSFLADHERLAASHTPDQLNQPLLALIRARKAINDARIALGHARRLHVDDKPAVAERLGTIAKSLTELHDQFPLTILSNKAERDGDHLPTDLLPGDRATLPYHWEDRFDRPR